jgi:serine/threonine protein kinase
VNDRPPVVVSRACRLDEAGKETRETYTLKRFPVMEADPRRQLVAELDGLLEMPPHLVVQPVDAFMDKLDAVLVLDDEGGRYLSESVSKLGAMPERLVSIVVRQVLSALVYIHNEKMRVHNNITPANLLVLRTGELKIGGFSFSSKAFMGHTSCKFAGDYAHMAPERLLGLECGFKADVWSVGILTLELLIGASPYDMARFTGPTAIFDFKKVVIQEPSPALRRGGE